MTWSMLTPRRVSGVKMRESQSRGAPAISGPMPRRSAASRDPAARRLDDWFTQ
jgi:hypothetical protein